MLLEPAGVLSLQSIFLSFLLMYCFVSVFAALKNEAVREREREKRTYKVDSTTIIKEEN